jgi:crotonobetainyl-CoA:carnitine CoA-transferase CaiB-like acyl-CoA transferase
MCADGKYVVIGGNGDSIYKRLMVTANRVDLANDPRLLTNPGRVTHQTEVDDAIAAWTASLPSMEVSVVDGLLMAC